MRRARILGWIAAMALGAGVSVAQETTGRLIVRTVDGDGLPLARVGVTIDSPSLIGGERTAATDDRGEASFLRLAPGVYRVRARLDGFVTQERREVEVRLGGATALTLVTPEARFAGEIMVVDETPVVDPAQVGAEQTFDVEYLRRTSIALFTRDYASSWSWQTPGTVPFSTGVFGSSDGENAWFIDGVDNTQFVNGTAGIALNLDAVKEVEVKTGGYEAEFGRALGAVVSVVTNSGGNSFSGSVDVRYVDDAFQEDGEHFDGDLQEQNNLEVGATIGGPILRDRLWFFVSASRTDWTFTPFGAPTSWNNVVIAPMAKLSWQASPSWRTELSYFWEDVDNKDYTSGLLTAAEAVGSDRAEKYAVSLGADGVLSDSLLWTLRLGADGSEYVERPSSGDVEHIAHVNYSTGMVTANHWVQEDSSQDRAQAATDLSWFAGGPLGSHEVKFGLQYSDMSWASTVCFTGTSGGAGCAPGVPGHVFLDIDVAGVDFPFQMLEHDPAGEQIFTGDLWGAYAQDTWRPAPRLSVKLGLRYDRVIYDNDAGDRVADMTEWQPRVGLAWDVSGDAKNLLRASVGRFMDPSTMLLPLAAASQWPTDYRWNSCSTFGPLYGFDPGSCQIIANAYGLSWRDDPEGWDPHGWFLDPAVDIGPGGISALIDPDLKAAYSDQLVLGYERELWPRSSVELSYINKKTRQLFDDTCQGNIPEPSEGADCSFYVMANLPQLRRDYEAFIISLESRGLDWLTVRASYILSESTGSTGGESNFDVYPWHFDNRHGYLDDHRRHYLRLHGFALLPYDLTLGFNAFWYSAWRWTPLADPADIPEMPYGEYFVEPRGNRKGYSGDWLGLQLSKGFRLGGARRLELIASMENVFSSEHPMWVCDEISGCGDFELGDPTFWYLPRSWQFGVRFEF